MRTNGKHDPVQFQLFTGRVEGSKNVQILKGPVNIYIHTRAYSKIHKTNELIVSSTTRLSPFPPFRVLGTHSYSYYDDDYDDDYDFDYYYR